MSSPRGIRRVVSGDHISLIFFLSGRLHHLGRLKQSSWAPAPLFSVGEPDLWHVKGAKHAKTLLFFCTPHRGINIEKDLLYPTVWPKKPSKIFGRAETFLWGGSGRTALKFTYFCSMPTALWFTCPRLALASVCSSRLLVQTSCSSGRDLDLTNHCSSSFNLASREDWTAEIHQDLYDHFFFSCWTVKWRGNVFYTMNALRMR